MSLLKNPVHPGVILQHEFLLPMSLSCEELARSIGVSPLRIELTVQEKIPITTDIAERFGVFFRTSVKFWLDLQRNYDLLRA